MKRGSQIAVSGTIRQTTDRAMRRRRHRCEIWDMANPASEATTTVVGTASVATSSELAMNRRTSTTSKMVR
jgi:hypothetical protein